MSMKEGNRNDAVGRTRTDVKFLLVLKRGNAAEVVRGESSPLPKDTHSLPHDGSNNAIANSDLIWGGRDRREEEEDSAQRI